MRVSGSRLPCRRLAVDRWLPLALAVLLLLAVPLRAAPAGSEGKAESTDGASTPAEEAWSPDSGTPPPFLKVECMMPFWESPGRFRARRPRDHGSYNDDMFIFSAPDVGDERNAMTLRLSLPDGTPLSADEFVWIPMVIQYNGWAEPTVQDGVPVVRFHDGAGGLDHIFVYKDEDYWCLTGAIRGSLSAVGGAVAGVGDPANAEDQRKAEAAFEAVKRRDYAKAHGIFEALAEAHPELAGPVNNALWCWVYGMGYSDIASGARLSRSIGAAHAVDDRAALLDTRAWWNMRRGSMARARRDAERAVQLQPWKPDVLRTLAAVELWFRARRTIGNAGARDGLTRAFGEILEEPEGYGPYHDAALTLLNLGYPAEARRLILCAARHRSHRSRAYADAEKLVAVSYRVQGRPFLAALAGRELTGEEWPDCPRRAPGVPAEWPLDPKWP
jgi:hypothetical protein